MDHSILGRLRLYAALSGCACVLLLAAIALRSPIALVIASAAAAVFASYLTLREARRLRAAIDATSASIGQFIRGSLDARVQNIGELDELGRLQHRLNNLFDIADLAARAQDAAVDTGDDAEYIAKLRQANLFRQLERVTAAPVAMATPAPTPLPQLAEKLSVLARKADALSSHARQASEGLAFGGGAGQQASLALHHMESVAATSEQLASAIKEISARVAEASEIAGQAVQYTQRSDSTMTRLTQASSRIGHVVKLIHDIAEQTNLLALNATIEAARAGDAGKGFAVVASEVKSLADQTTKATEEISQQVEGIQSSTEEAVRTIGGINGIIGRIDEISTAIAAAVEQQSAASLEISRAIGEAAEQTRAVQPSEPPAHVATALEATLDLAQDMASHMAGLEQELRHAA